MVGLPEIQVQVELEQTLLLENLELNQVAEVAQEGLTGTEEQVLEVLLELVPVEVFVQMALAAETVKMDKEL